MPDGTYLSPDTVRTALRILTSRSYRKVGRTAVMGWLLLHAKLPLGERRVEITSQGESSVEAELRRFFAIAPGTPLPYINPFGTTEGRPEYLANGYERRGTYTHLYPERNLEKILDVAQGDGSFVVTIPESAAADIRDKLGDAVPWQAAAGFLLRHEKFQSGNGAEEIKQRLKTIFQISDLEFESLFDDLPSFAFELGLTEFVDAISSLPPELQPKLESSTHSTTARAGRELVALAPSPAVDLIISNELRRRIQRACQRSKAVALLGAPGTAKSRIWETLLEEAGTSPSILGLKNSPSYLCYSAEVDWTARTLVGGYYPQENGRLVFREGYLLQAIRNNQIFWIDEMNRADLDRVLGPIFTFLAGQSVDLGPDHLGSGPSKSMVLVWSKKDTSGVEEDEEQRVYYAGSDWRIIGTYNNVDRGRVFPMGSALTRRWALVPVTPLADSEIEKLLFQINGVREPVVSVLSKAYAAHRDYLQIGPAPFLEMARYIADAHSTTTTGTLSSDENDLLQDAYVIYMGQQIARIDPERRKEFLNVITSIFGPVLAAEINTLW